jgi:uncharacterized membrane protein YsdA (DUF1294 family)/cold shock CspA family protein
MRFDGKIKSWNDDRGFGFIEPLQGGDELFVHITAFPARAGRPQVTQRVSFEIEIARDGKKHASNVRLVHVDRAARYRRPVRGGSASSAGLFMVPLFLVLYVTLAFVWRVPNVVALAYLVLSGVSFAVYAGDKAAATAGGWRTRESSLLLLALVGGWPGALLAQQLLRHKTAKPAFVTAFWGSVVLNVAAFIALSSPQFGAWATLR